jgi:hypothetical protein
MNIGFGSEIPAEFIRVILRAWQANSLASSPVMSAPIGRLIRQAEAEGRLIKATHGRKVRAVIVTDSNHVVTSAIHPETLMARFAEERREK